MVSPRAPDILGAATQAEHFRGECAIAVLLRREKAVPLPLPSSQQAPDAIQAPSLPPTG